MWPHRRSDNIDPQVQVERRSKRLDRSASVVQARCSPQSRDLDGLKAAAGEGRGKMTQHP